MRKVIALFLLVVLGILIGCGGNPYQKYIDDSRDSIEKMDKSMERFERNMRIFHNNP